MNIYKLQSTCTCPADKMGDVYDVTVTSRRMIWTDQIGAACADLAKETIPQEEFTRRLARRLGAQVTTEGVHPAFMDEAPNPPPCSSITVICTHGHA